MATPNFNNELLKLRRRLGDINTEDKIEIDVATVGFLDGEVWKASEIADIYNDAVVDYLDFAVTSLRGRDLYMYIPGFIFYNPLLSINSGRLGIDSLDPQPLVVVDLWKQPSDGLKGAQFSYISSNEFFLTMSGKFPYRTPSIIELYYTLMEDSVGEAIFTLPVESFTGCTLIYVKRYVPIVSDSTVDLLGINRAGLRRILDFAEVEAIKLKQGAAPELIAKILENKAKMSSFVGES